jgi:hypothetical protein
VDWINLHIPSVIRSPEFIGSSPAERGTWVCVLAYACEIECGGRLVGAAGWKDRQWQQACGVTMREVRAAGRLLQVDGLDVMVNGYPIAKEREVVAKRGAGAQGAMSKWQTPPPGQGTGKHTRSLRLAAARALGTHSQDEWQAMVDHFRVCVRCGITAPLVKDHIVPLYQGGSDAITNIQPLCRSCNSSKGPDRTDFRRGRGCPDAWLPSAQENAKQNAWQMPGRTPAEGEGEVEGEGEGSSQASPTDSEDLTTPTATAPAKRVAHGLGTWVAYHARDAERKAENLAQIDELVGRYGAQVVQAAAERIVARKAEKAWPNELLPEILAGTAPAAGDDQPHVAQAKRLVAKHGWERCREAIDLPMLKTADEVVHCMVCEGRCLDLVRVRLGDA